MSCVCFLCILGQVAQELAAADGLAMDGFRSELGAFEQQAALGLLQAALALCSPAWRSDRCDFTRSV